MAINFGSTPTAAPAPAASAAPLLNLQKGEILNITKASNNSRLNKIFLSGGWDVSESSKIDVDIVAILTGTDDKVRDANDAIYFSHKSAAGISLGEDNRSGVDSKKNVPCSDDKDDEIMQISLQDIDPAIHNIHFYIVIYEAEKNRQTFGMIKNSFARVVDMETQKELCRVLLSGSEYMTDTIVEVAKLKRSGDTWEVEAVKQGFVGDVNAAYGRHM